MALERFVVNLSLGGVGEQGEIVMADPVLWAVYIEAGYMSSCDEAGNRLGGAHPVGPLGWDPAWNYSGDGGLDAVIQPETPVEVEHADEIAD